MYNPISTYRIQFNKHFNIKMLGEQIEYISLLGAGTIYASPVFRAISGSTHGYDVVNPLEFNPEITNPDGFKSIHNHLKKQEIGWMQDIVPNHMAFHPENTWLMDVLEKGPDSVYHKTFDLEPGVPGPGSPLMVPLLGSSLTEAIRANYIQLGWKNGNFSIKCYDNDYPCRFESFREILKAEIPGAPGLLKKHWLDLGLYNNSPTADFLNTSWETSKKRLDALLQSNHEIRQFIEQIIQASNSREHIIQNTLQAQYFRLCHWQETEKTINYRRFFTVNGLICLRMEDPEVFEKYHPLIAQMTREGYFKGLRIDHIDGLNDPNGYLEKLRKLVGKDIYIVAEKILEYDEEFPEFWPIQGNTGYDFLAIVNNLLTNTKNYNLLKILYKEVTNFKGSPSELIYQNKKLILTTRMQGEWDNIAEYFNRLHFIDYKKEKISKEEIKEAIGEFMLACPVYRLYPREFPLRDKNRKMVEEIILKAKKRNPAIAHVLDRFSDVLLSSDQMSADGLKNLEKIFSRLMQFTGPLMAKGVEDTSMYQHNSFITHNEVGDAINARGITMEEFHQQMSKRHTKWPLTMNTTSTHDTKRGEDVRARLNIISELTEEWEGLVHKWMQMNQKLKTRLDSGLLEPSLSVEYFIYQTLLGTYPFNGSTDEVYLKRIEEYLIKALREAKRKVSWRDPNETYEQTVCEFVRKILDPKHDFSKNFVPFQQKVAWRGVINSLTQLTLKCTSPGVPDIYQGTELWDLSLVDPDNRQPVDYAQRHSLLKKTIADYNNNPKTLIRKLSDNPFDGRIKLWLTYFLLNLRKNNQDLFLKGDYIPLSVEGKLKKHIMGFARRYDNHWIVVVVPLITAQLSQKSSGEYLSEVEWDNTRVLLPAIGKGKWKNLLTGEETDFLNAIPVGEIFKHSYVGLLGC